MEKKMRKSTGGSKNAANMIGIFLIVIGFIAIGNVCKGSTKKKNRKQKMTVQETTQKTEWNNLAQRKIQITTATADDAEPDLTRNVYFIIDGSGSMSERTGKNCGEAKKFRNKLAGAKWAVKQFIQTVPESIAIGLYIFDNNGRREVVPLGKKNREKFLNQIESIRAGGGTPLYDAIRFATDKLIEKYKYQLGYGEFRIVVVTDGIASHVYDAAKYAASYGIPLYSIGLCVGPDHPLRKYSVQYQAADNFEALSKGLTETLAELPVYDLQEFNTEEK